MTKKMTTSNIQIATPDGPATVEVAKPEGKGPWPAVIVFYDAAGLRPAQTRIAERIAASGYLVLQPDLFHRSPPLSGILGGEPTLGALMKVFGDPEQRSKFMAGWYLPALSYANLEKTIGAVLDHIAGRDDVRGRIGTSGYCMGGNASVRTATIFGSRISMPAACTTRSSTTTPGTAMRSTIRTRTTRRRRSGTTRRSPGFSARRWPD